MCDNNHMKIKELLPLIAAAVLYMIGCISGTQYERHEFQKDAVKHNAAHWNVTDDGKTSFAWNISTNK